MRTTENKTQSSRHTAMYRCRSLVLFSAFFTYTFVCSFVARSARKSHNLFQKMPSIRNGACGWFSLCCSAQFIFTDVSFLLVNKFERVFFFHSTQSFFSSSIFHFRWSTRREKIRDRQQNTYEKKKLYVTQEYQLVSNILLRYKSWLKNLVL